MMHKAWSNIEEVPYCFSRSYLKLQGHMAKKLSILIRIERFRTVTPVWINWWLWNDARSFMQYRRGALLFLAATKQLYKWFSTLLFFKRFRTVTPVWINWWLWNDAQSFTQYRRGALLLLAATKQLYKWFSPSIHPSVTPFSLCSHHRIIMKFSGVITNDKNDIHANSQGQKSKVKVIEVKTPLDRFQTVTPV